jgi:hypothetical protein
VLSQRQVVTLHQAGGDRRAGRQRRQTRLHGLVGSKTVLVVTATTAPRWRGLTPWAYNRSGGAIRRGLGNAPPVPVRSGWCHCP